MDSVERAPEGFFAATGGSDDFTQARLAWLIALRWVAMAGVAGATLLSALGFFPGAAWPVMAAVVVLGCTYNALLAQSLRDGTCPTGQRAAITQALIDLAMLTTVLWAAGGIRSPFLGYYIFHVALIAILGGPRATLIAAATAFAEAGFLALTLAVPALQIGEWDPSPPWDTLAEVGAFVTMLATATYIVAHAARELREREHALSQARDRAALEYQLLSNTLDELDAGLEVLDADGRVLWRNRGAAQLAPVGAPLSTFACHGAENGCEREGAPGGPVALAREAGETGRCRFATRHEARERLFELLSFPLTDVQAGDARVMNLYVDRTQDMLAERRLVLAERLASLGRIAQGVAHELNTPLATIRTLATDMQDALGDVRAAGAATALVDDLGESAALIGDETRRLGRITQSLLAGGDLVRARVDEAVGLDAVAQRARALVVAGLRGGIVVRVDDSLAGRAVSADSDRLVQILVNLLQNAIDSVREAGGAEVVLSARDLPEGLALIVEDDGAGIPSEIEGRLFEPFATSKPPGEGTGLGLYTSYMLAKGLGGELTLENRDGAGARATLLVPHARASTPSNETALEKGAVLAHGEPR